MSIKAQEPELAVVARRCALDIALMLILFVSISLTAGRVWRFPFDDELIALTPIEQSRSALDLILYYLKGFDIHPPLSFLLFYVLSHLGLSEAGLRLCSLGLTALSLALFHLVTLALICRRAELLTTTRLIAALTFGLTPLAIGQGDAIRWYPPFSALVSIFFALYLFGGGARTRWLSAVPLGLAASTNFIAALVIAPLAIFRYALQRRFCWRFDLSYWLAVLVLAMPGAVSGYSLAMRRFGSAVHTEFGHGVGEAVLTNLLGFFGGNALGVSQIWIVVPGMLIAGAAIVAALDRKDAGNPLNLLLLMLAAVALMTLGGFAKSRSFLYLAPAVTLLIVLWLDDLLRCGKVGAAVAASVLWLVGAVAATVNLNGGAHPFKRNAVVPYQTILDFIDRNAPERVLVMSTDPIVPWVLLHRSDGVARCIAYFLQARRCLEGADRYDSVVVVSGHNDRSATGSMAVFRRLVARAIEGRQKIATLAAGQDDDAALKSRLTGVPLERAILTVEVYR